MDKIKLFSSQFSGFINDIDKKFILRHNINPDDNKLNFANTLYASSILLNCTGVDNVVSDLEIDKIVTVSKTALIKKRNSENTYECVRNMNDKLLEIFYNKDNNFIKKYSYILDKNKMFYIKSDKPDKDLFINNTKYIFVANDGMQLTVAKEAINKNDIKGSKSGKYGVVLISSFYDIFNEIPISYHKTYSDINSFNKKKANESVGFLQQIDKLNSNNIVVFDRLYYSNKLHKKLVDKNIGYMFRMRDNSKLFKDISKGKHKIKNVNGVDVQLFKYKVKGHLYNILTSITDTISVGEIRAIYWKRWKIETDNKKFKYDILRTNIRSKKYYSLSVDIECVKFMSILSSIIEHISEYDIFNKSNKKINSKNCIHILYKKLLYLLFYDNKNYDEIGRLIGIIYKKVIAIVTNRSYKRIRIKPSTKWNEHGNRFGNKNK